MSAREIVIIGAGGFGRETADVIEAINRSSSSPVWQLSGFYDDSPSEVNLSRLASRRSMFLGPIPSGPPATETSYVVGIGNPSARQFVAGRLESMGWIPEILVHPDAVVGSRVQMGRGTVICGGVQISTNVNMGRHVHVNPNATIGHDSILSEYVSVNPAATISGEVHVEELSLVGAAATILQGRRIGAHSVIGAAACVVRDVTPGAVVKGVPAQ